MYARDTPLSEDLYIFVAEPEGVGGNDIGTQHTQPVQVFDRGETAVKFLAVSHFLLRLGNMDVDLEAVFAGEFRCPDKVGFADGIDGVGSNRELGISLPAERSLILAFAFLPLAADGRRIPVVQQYIGKDGTYAHLPGGPAGFVRNPILVVEGGGSRLDHLQTGHLGAPVNEILVYLGFQGPDVVQPFVQVADILRDTAHQAHGRVGMHVDEAGKGYQPACIEDFYPFRDGKVPRGSDAEKPSVPDVDIARASFDGNVLDKY